MSAQLPGGTKGIWDRWIDHSSDFTDRSKEPMRTPRTDEQEFGSTADAMTVDAAFARMLERELNQEAERAKKLEAIIMKHREGVARFLVPYRNSLPESWLDHFVEECGVEFDEIGFVSAKKEIKL